MRRAIATLALLGALVAFAALAMGADGGGAVSRGYRVDVVFDTAKGLLPGQLVKIAGARSGEIADVRLTGDFKARVQLRVDETFAPFRSDARCTIQPEGLIGENFVQCDPGRRGRPLEGDDGGAPTVSVERTTVPVSFPELFDIATVPVRQRLSLVVAELGLGVAGRGEQLNDVARRASPTLDLVRRLGALLDRQGDDLERAVVSTDRVADQLARRAPELRELVRRTGRVTSRTGAEAAQLRDAVRRLPGLLAGTRDSLRGLDAVVAQGTPLLADLREAAPQAERLVGGLVPFAQAARPALRDLGRVARTGTRVVRRAAPTVDLLRRFTTPALAAGVALEPVLRDLRDSGALDNLVSGFYGAAVANARYDEQSHFLPLRTTITTCSLLARTPVQGCQADYTEQAVPAAKRRRAARDRAPAAREPDAAGPAAPQRQDDAPARAPAPPQLPKTGIDAVDGLLDRLTGKGAPPPQRPDAVTPLLDLLLGR